MSGTSPFPHRGGYFAPPARKPRCGPFLFFLLLFMCVPGPCTAGELPSCREILGRVSQVNKGLESFKADLEMDVCWMGMRMPMTGVLYFKRPDMVRLVIPSIPRWLKGKGDLFREMVPRSFNSKDYTGTVEGLEKPEGAASPCYVLRLVPRKEGRVTGVMLWVDRETLTTLASVVEYGGSGKITSNQKFAKTGPFLLPSAQEVDFNLRQFNASVKVRFTGYELNVPVDKFLQGYKPGAR